MSDTELLCALEYCADKDFARCAHCPLRFMGEGECRRQLAQASLSYIQAQNGRINLALQMLKREN